MSVTIKDIARIANVSHTTVSRALNNSPFIKEETKERIQIIAKKLNYVPNYNAKSLVLKRSYNIGLFFSTIKQGTSPAFFYNTVCGVNGKLKKNYNLVIRGIDDYKDFLSIDNRRFDGIILMSQSDSDDAFICDVLKKEIPIVVLNREISEKSVVNILSAEKKGTYEAIEYLIKNGHKDIAIIEGKENFKSTFNRKEGFIQAMSENNLTIRNEYMVKGEYDTTGGYNAMKKLLSASKIPTAVFCSNDDMAVGAMKAVFDSGLNVPDDISIIGFDDSDLCRYVTPTLTSVRKPIGEVSAKGAEKILKIIEGKKVKHEKICIETNLVIRDSVKKIS